MAASALPADYTALLGEIRQRVRQAQARAVRASDTPSPAWEKGHSLWHNPSSGGGSGPPRNTPTSGSAGH